MHKNIKDMSLADIEAELSRARSMNDRISQIQNMILNVSEDMTSMVDKLRSITQAIDHVGYAAPEQLSIPGISDVPAELLAMPFVQRKTISKSKIITGAIREILKTDSLNSNEIHQKLVERGLVKPIDSEFGRLDYNFTRSIISAMKKRGDLYRGKEDRGEPWKLKQ